MITATVNCLRLIGIVRTLARHDALWLFARVPGARVPVGIVRLLWGRRRDGRPGQKLAAALTDLGPSFIKLGQALSVRADLIGDQVAEDLSLLQDRLPAFPTKLARQSIESELGGTVETLFSRFDEIPVAAASIAQVHFAETPDGREVAVKVLRPGVEDRFDHDLQLFHWLAVQAERFLPSTRRLRPVDVVATFRDWVMTEMDLRLEGAAASELAGYSRDDAGFRVIAVDWERTGRRVLTTERIHGTRIDDIETLREAGFDPDELLERSARIFFLQVFRDGFFHADMHPGNMFVDREGNLCPVDFGIMGRIDKRTRIFLADLLVGFLQRDYRQVAQVHFDFGIVPPTKSTDAFTQAIRAVGEPVLDKPLNEISVGRLLAQLFKVTEDFDMETQPDLLLLQKTMLVAEGVGRRLNPAVNMWVMAQPLIEEWMIANRGPEARLRDTVAETVDALRRLPVALRRAEDVLEKLSDVDPAVIDRLAGRRGGAAGPVRRLARSGARQGWGPVMVAVVAVLAVVLVLE